MRKKGKNYKGAAKLQLPLADDKKLIRKDVFCYKTSYMYMIINNYEKFVKA